MLSWWRLKLKWRIIGFRKKLSRERAREEHMTGSWRVVPGCRFRECLAGKAFPRDSRETICLEDFYVWLPYPSPILYILSLPTNVREAILREKPYIGFLQHTPIFLRESYSSLVRNHCSLFCIPHHYHTLRGDLYPNTIHTFLECSECFWSCWEALEEAKDDRCNMKLVAGSGELDKTRFQETLLE